jgi:hypothetical protein
VVCSHHNANLRQQIQSPCQLQAALLLEWTLSFRIDNSFVSRSTTLANFGCFANFCNSRSARSNQAPHQRLGHLGHSIHSVESLCKILQIGCFCKSCFLRSLLKSIKLIQLFLSLTPVCTKAVWVFPIVVAFIHII